MSQEATVHVLHNPSRDFTALPPRRGAPEAAPRGVAPLDLIVALRRSGTDGLHMTAFRPGERGPRTRIHHAYLTASVTSVLRTAGRLRTTWRDLFVRHQPVDADGTAIAGFPLAEAADLTPHSAVAELLTAELAREGQYLLDRLLAGENHEVKEFRSYLLGVLGGEEGLRISFDSDLHLPWPMLAVERPDDRHPFAGFLGYRHQVEQTGASYPMIQGEMARRRLPAASLNTDVSLAHVGRAPQVRKLLEERATLTVRAQSATLLSALAEAVVDDDIMYFWCHGRFVDNGSQHHHLAVKLSDERCIDADLVLRERTRYQGSPDAVFRPFVLLNACHTGQAAASPELEHLGKALVDMGACGVLGSQIEIPQCFAAEYAYAFLDLYLGSGLTAGEITMALVHRFAREFANPLALTYSLHCGIDSRMEATR
ncbi:CHAT domain-containing protein [Streptomyces sp. NPDC057099]|uniref:CHAT domain-containing protein n=1 Tax=Streptomyces sp. NPDC057099 TaxID=3346019 RepID=UPI003631C7DB